MDTYFPNPKPTNLAYGFDFFPYQYSFSQPVVTAHGTWTDRQGLIIQLRHPHGPIAQGEIAPIPWFGTENLTEATNFCQSLNGNITSAQIAAIGDRLPCCQFALGSAEGELGREIVCPRNLDYCQLLPTGEPALTYLGQIKQLKKLSPKTFKWKIGVQDFETEKQLCEQILAKLPAQTTLRLDANGGLTSTIAQRWLSWLDRQGQNKNYSVLVEYVEQPLPPQEIKTMVQLSQDFLTPIALDETIASYSQLRQVYDQGWPGFYILKGAILGDPRRLNRWLAQHPGKMIFSSVFETAIARRQVLKLAQQWNLPGYAVGFSPPIAGKQG